MRTWLSPVKVSGVANTILPSASDLRASQKCNALGPAEGLLNALARFDAQDVSGRHDGSCVH